MRKKLKLSPNERVDIPDLTRAANTYTDETSAFLTQRALMGDRGHALGGFRVRVVNSAGNPAQVTVYNGTAADETGTLLSNDTDPAYAQGISLTGSNAVFWLELEFAETDSDEDSRAFWDPTIPNTLPIPNGQEFNASVVTRITPTWKIVRPVRTGTQGFSWSKSNPGSTKVPLMRLATNASNEILAAQNPGLVYTSPSSVLLASVSTTDTILAVSDAALFSDSPADFAVELDPDALYGGPYLRDALYVDRQHNLITISAPVGPGLPAGARIVSTGIPAQFVEVRKAGLLPAEYPATSTHPDRISRLFQGEEARGAGLLVDPADGTLRSDTALSDMKRYVDFMASQIREIKWGSPVPGVTSEAPPTAFTSTRYFDNSGGIAGSRAATVTVGDGVTTYGDFNGTDEVPFNAAVAVLNATGGGVLYAKAGSYTVANPIVLTQPVLIYGDPGATTITSADGTVFQLTSVAPENHVQLRDLIINAGSGYVLEDPDGQLYSFDAHKCSFIGRFFMPRSSMRSISAELCTFALYDGTDAAIFSGDGSSTGLSVKPATLHISKCSIDTAGTTDCVFLSFESPATGAGSLVVQDCYANLGDGGIVVYSASATHINLKNIVYDQDPGESGATEGGSLLFCATVRQVLVEGVYVRSRLVSVRTASASFIYVGCPDNLVVRDVWVGDFLAASTANTGSFLKFGDSNSAAFWSTSGRSVLVENCHVALFGGTFVDHAAYAALSPAVEEPYRYTVTVRNNVVAGFLVGFRSHSAGEFFIHDNVLDGFLIGQYGVHVGAQLDGITQTICVHDNVIKTLTNPGVSQLAGVFVDAGTTAGLLSNFCDVNITGNHIVGVGYGTNALNSSVAGVLIPGNFYTNSCVVKDNLISFIQSGTGGSTFGVLASTTPTAAGNSILTIADNTITDIGQVGFPPVAAYGVVCLKLLSSDPIVNTTIRGNTIKRLIASSGSCTPIWILGSALLKNTQVCDNSIEGIYASAPNTAGLILIQASSVYDLVVQGNTLTTGGLSFQRSAFSIDVQMLTSTGFASGITITKNRVIDFGGIHVSGVYLSPNISAVNNIIINDNNLLLGDNNSLSGIQVDNCAVSGLTISANTIADFAGLARFGVAIYGVSNTVRAKNVAISNNTVISTDSTKGDFAGIYLYYTTGFTITGNMVNWGAEGNNDSRAILLVGVKQGSVSGNLCVPTGLRTATIELTLTFPTECEYVLVSGNVVNSATWTAGTIAGIDANVHHTYGSTSSGADVRDYLNLGA